MRDISGLLLIGFGMATAGWAGAQGQAANLSSNRIDLPSSKQIVGVVPGAPQRLNSLPVAMAVSRDGRWVVTVNGGYGSFESGYMQSLAVEDTRTGRVEDFPDARTLVESKQVLFSGLAFSQDESELYGSVVSASDPEGKAAGDTGAGVQVYSFTEGKIARKRLIRIPLQKLAAGRRTKLVGGVEADRGLPYPAAIAVVPMEHDKARGLRRNECLLIADNLSDDVLLLDTHTGAVLHRFDLAENDAVPSVYPIAVVLGRSRTTRDGARAFVALSNASEVVELDVVKGAVGRKLPLLKPDSAVAAGSHPTALAMSPDGQTVYVALGNRDAVAAVDVSGGGFKLKGYFDARLPGQTFYGAQPEALALNADGSRLYVANMGSDAVAVIDTRKLTKAAVAKGMVEPNGFIPTEWMPMGVAFAGGKVYVASGKGTGTGPNNFAQRPTPETKERKGWLKTFSYMPTLLHGSLAAVEETVVARDLKRFTAEVLEDNRMRAGEERIAWAAGVLGREEAGSAAALRNGKREGVAEARQTAGETGAGEGPIRHVIYIIKENRTYDQVLGDLSENGKPVGNGDKRLTMYGAAITPNLHKLALQFGVLDNFYDSGEVSGDGHVWSTSAINSDYNERTWQLNYRGGQHGYDYEGVVSQGLPLAQGIADVDEPGSGYLWGNLARHGKTLYHFGEFISSTFCNEKGRHGAVTDPRAGPMLEGKTCAKGGEVKPGEAIPAEWGGGVNQWPWPLPLLASNVATKPELVGHFAKEAPDFNLRIPDQVRVEIFLKHLRGWVEDRKAGRDTMPDFVMLRLANDHTAGTTLGGPTPKSSIADNDLAVGRAVEAISHTDFWADTAFFILEDDAQSGADHVDAHRSLGLVISKYSPRAADGGAFVDSRFYSTVSMVRTMETVLGVPPMNNNDAFSSLIGSLFTGPGDQAAFVADVSNRENRLIYKANTRQAAGAAESARMDFRHADRADARKLNAILWRDAMGDKAIPVTLLEKRKKARRDGDD